MITLIYEYYLRKGPVLCLGNVIWVRSWALKPDYLRLNPSLAIIVV